MEYGEAVTPSERYCNRWGSTGCSSSNSVISDIARVQHVVCATWGPAVDDVGGPVVSASMGSPQPQLGNDDVDPGGLLKVLTWNLAMFERSADAPTYWGQADTEATVRQRVLDIGPDVIAYQELPGLVPFVETHDMIRANPRSHSGNLATLVTHELMASKPTFTTVKRAALLTTFTNLDLTVANVHLTPGRGAGEQRRAQIRRILDKSPTDRLLIVGDTNTRVDEEDTIGGLDLDTPRPLSPTWDGHRNRFRGAAGSFRAYFTRAFSRGDLVITDQSVLDDPVELDGELFHISDHFALLVTVAV